MKLQLNNSVQRILWIVAYLGIAAWIGTITRDNIPNWYRPLEKPRFTPPDYVFPLAWTTLYVILALVGHRLFTRRQDYGMKLFSLYAAQMLMNWGWSFVFFKYHLLPLSVLWIGVLLLMIATLIYSAWQKDRTVALALMPYIGWVGFATYLNTGVWLLNR